MTTYVPADYEGEQVTCSSCGHPAPKRQFADARDECSPCFIGRTANQLVTRRETQAMIAELREMITDTTSAVDDDILGKAETLYEKCKHCHLFIEDNSPGNNPADMAANGGDIADWVHLNRGDEADEAIEETHNAEPSGLIATLNVWKKFGPPAMIARFTLPGFKSDVPPYPMPADDFIGVQLLHGVPWESIDHRLMGTEPQSKPAYLVAFTGGHEMPSYTFFDNEPEARAKFEEYKADFRKGEGDDLTLIEYDPATGAGAGLDSYVDGIDNTDDDDD